MPVSRREFLAATAAGMALSGLGRAEEATVQTKGIVLLAGPRSHGYGEHEHPASCQLMADRLNRIDGIEATVVLSWPADESLLHNTDALIVYADGGSQHPLNGHFEKLATLLRGGLGLGLLHYALVVEGDEPRRQMLEGLGGYYEPNWSVNPMWTADFGELHDHPVTRGITPFALNDEWYYHMRFRPEMRGVTPLLTTLPTADSLSRPDGPHSGNPHVRKAVLDEKQPQHLAWCVERGDGGRGLGFTGLHWHWNWAHDGFRTFLLNAACWLAHAPVPKAGIRSPRPTLDDLVKLIGPPPAEWNRQSVVARMNGWQSR
jgi:hypothetical protein